MADSDNTRTLPSVTRERLLAIAARSRLAAETDPTAAHASDASLSVDPALSLWSAWDATYQRACRLGRRQQRLERDVIAIAGGFPNVTFRVSGQDEPVTVESEEAIDRWLGDGPETVMMRAEAKATLAARQRAWDEADERIGYSGACEAEQDAQDEYEQLAETLWESSASSAAGVAAKLHAMMVVGEYREGCEEFPWPQIRVALADLLRIEGEPV